MEPSQLTPTCKALPLVVDCARRDSHGSGVEAADNPLDWELEGDYELAARTTLGPHVERHLQQRVRSGALSVKAARNHRTTLHRLAACHGNRPAHQLGRATLQTWAETLGRLHASTRRLEVSRVHLFLRWLTAERVLQRDPSAALPKIRQPRSVPRALDGDMVEKLWLAVPDVRGQAIVMLMFGLGLRCVEVERLRVEDWSRRDQLIRIVGKGGHERELPVPNTVAAAVDAYLNQHPACSGPLVRSYRDPHQPLHSETLSGMVSEWMHDAGIKQRPGDGVSAHALRHTAASDLLDACDDLRVVQEFLGHSHLATTSIYLRRAGTAKMRDALAARWATPAEVIELPRPHIPHLTQGEAS